MAILENEQYLMLKRIFTILINVFEIINDNHHKRLLELSTIKMKDKLLRTLVIIILSAKTILSATLYSFQDINT